MKDETMGNQQEIPTQAELGWLAGIIDGEGSITLNVRRKKWKGWNGIGVDLGISIVNSDAGIIQKSLNIINKMGIEPHLFERKGSPIRKPDGDGFYQNKTRTLICLNISKMKSILSVLTELYPHFGGDKQHRAELATKFIERRLTRQTKKSKGGPTWYDGYDWNIVKKFYEISGGKLLPEVQEILNDYTPDPNLG